MPPDEFSPREDENFPAGLWAQRAADLGRRIPRELLEGRVVGRLSEKGHRARGIACSGGIDSLCLLLLSVAHFPECPFFVLHYNHAQRGEESDGDEAWLRRVAENLGLPFFSDRGSAWGHPSEADLRRDRYAFFERILSRERSRQLLLGHQRDDVCESWVMNTARGASLGALASPPAVQQIGSYWRLRPLIHLERRRLAEALRAAGIPWREDSSNRGDAFLRNRVRHHLLPMMEKVFPQRPWKAGWQHTWQQIREADEFLRFHAERFSDLLPNPSPDFSPLRGQPRALWRFLLNAWLGRQGLRAQVRPGNFKNILEALSEGGSFSCSLGMGKGLRVKEWRLGLVEECSAKRKNFSRFSAEGENFSRLWDSPRVAVAGGFLEKRPCPWPEGQGQQGVEEQGLRVRVGLPERQPLLLRNWRAGDAYRPFGLSGTKKLKKMFQERRVPPEKRRRLPVIALPESGKIVWVPFLPLGEDFRVPEGSDSALELTFHEF
ncbi:MAG: tRNA lysidine(34) synthetase TilS [Puniceicoccales bacterium]|jgi:tRNA(Ile)-lysidine synthetase-like protein|nr:tRNA lysidine(34) synthetase TilS [Puniceicoccales bacterium]